MAIKIDGFAASKRETIHRWLLERLNDALKNKRLRTVDQIPWVCFGKGTIQGHAIKLQGWPVNIQLKRFMLKKDCENVSALIRTNEIALVLERKH